MTNTLQVLAHIANRFYLHPSFRGLIIILGFTQMCSDLISQYKHTHAHSFICVTPKHFLGYNHFSLQIIAKLQNSRDTGPCKVQVPIIFKETNLPGQHHHPDRTCAQYLLCLLCVIHYSYGFFHSHSLTDSSSVFFLNTEGKGMNVDLGVAEKCILCSLNL